MTEGQTNPEQPQVPPTPPKSNPFREPVVLWSVVGGVIVIALAVGYIVWNHAHKGGGSAASALANRSVCEATLDRVRDYGVIPPSTELASPDPDKTQTDGRVTCHGKSGDAQFAMMVDVRCDDMSKASCLELYSVKQNDGTSLFQRQR